VLRLVGVFYVNYTMMHGSTHTMNTYVVCVTFLKFTNETYILIFY